MSSLERNKALARRWLALVSAHDVDATIAITSPSWAMHGGPPGLPARGRRQRFSAMFMHRIADGRIGETWRNADDLGRVLQLGARLEIGAPAEPAAHATAAGTG